jgi:hypothetical protein
MEEDFEDAIESEELVAAGSVRAVHHDVASPAQSRGTVGGCDDATHSELQSSTEALRLEMERRIVREAELEAANAELRAELARREQTIQEAASLVEQERRRADALESLADERAEAYLAERSGLLAERDDLLFERSALLSQREALNAEFGTLQKGLADARAQLLAVQGELDGARHRCAAAQAASQSDATRASEALEALCLAGEWVRALERRVVEGDERADRLEREAEAAAARNVEIAEQLAGEQSRASEAARAGEPRGWGSFEFHSPGASPPATPLPPPPPPPHQGAAQREAPGAHSSAERRPWQRGGSAGDPDTLSPFSSGRSSPLPGRPLLRRSPASGPSTPESAGGGAARFFGAASPGQARLDEPPPPAPSPY